MVGFVALVTETLIAIAFVVFFGGLVKGVAGFGYAIASTALLATFLDPSVAVTIMILPMLIANLSLLTELDREDFRTCIARFWPYLGAALIGTLVGMALLGLIPKPVLALLLGVFTLGYVLVTQPYVRIPGEDWFVDRCFRPGFLAKAILGLVSGVVFGASNIGVQVVAYLDTLELDRSTFVGVLAMILVGISGVRVGAAWYLGLYEAGSLLALSIGAIVPGLLGVRVGGALRQYVPETYQTGGTMLLLSVIGVRLVTNGAGAL